MRTKLRWHFIGFGSWKWKSRFSFDSIHTRSYKRKKRSSPRCRRSWISPLVTQNLLAPCFLLFLAPCGKGEWAPPSSNPTSYRWELLGDIHGHLQLLQLPIFPHFLLLPFLLLAWVCESRERERDELEREWESESEWVSWVLALVWVSMKWIAGLSYGDRWNSKVTPHIHYMGCFWQPSAALGDSPLVSKLTDRDWILLGHENELADSPMVLADSSSNQ
jgi:hypothetical protein